MKYLILFLMLLSSNAYSKDYYIHYKAYPGKNYFHVAKDQCNTHGIAEGALWPIKIESKTMKRGNATIDFSIYVKKKGKPMAVYLTVKGTKNDCTEALIDIFENLTVNYGWTHNVGAL